MAIDKVIAMPGVMAEPSSAAGADMDIEIVIEGEEGEGLFSTAPEVPEIGHGDNLAEIVAREAPEALSAFSSKLLELVASDEKSREEWKEIFREGLKLMGIGKSNADESDEDEVFKGASRLFVPLITEACVHFQSEALKAMLPPHGPVGSRVVGDRTPEKEAQARRVKNFMNYQVTEEIVDYFEEHDKLLAYVGKSGSAFKKVSYNGTTSKIEVVYLPAEQVVIPYNATSIHKTPRITHMETIGFDELQHRIANGLYRNIEISPAEAMTDEVREALDNQQGVEQVMVEVQPEYSVYEIHVDTVIPLFDGDRGGLSAPYIVHIDSESKAVLGIYRNWREGDPVYARRAYFTHYALVQSDGFYGYGFIHLLGQFARAASAILRQLLDAGTLSNLQGGFKRSGTKMAGDGEPLAPGEFRDVDVFGERIADSVMQLKFNEPSTVLYQLLGFLVDAGRRMVSLTDLNVGDGNQEAPVGTTIALLERGMNVMSAVHMRLCRAQKEEFKIIARMCSENLPDKYPYDVPNETREVYRTDFDDRVDVIPICDPRQFSQAQRLTRAQNKLQLASQAPQFYDLREAHRDMLAEIDDSNLDRILPPPQDAEPTDPMTENSDAIMGRPLKAFLEQNHQAHIQAHAAQLQNPQFQDHAELQQALQAHIQEHMAMKYKVDMMQAMGVQDPEQMQQVPPEQLAILAAQATDQITGRAQAVAEAEARAQEPTIEQQALMQELENDAKEIARKQQEGLRKAALERDKAQFDFMAEVASIKQRDRAAEMTAASRLMDTSAKVESDMRGQFINLVAALQNANQREQERDANLDL